MADILEEIVAHKRIEMEQRKRFISPRQMVTLTDRKIKADEGLTPGGSMRDALMSSSTGIIAEFKRKSPSKGWIKEEGKASVIPLGYQQNGASALSILTDIDYFGGYDEYIQEARHVGVTLPILYKNFVVEEYQLLQARYCGASAVLLIAACLTKQECKDLLNWDWKSCWRCITSRTSNMLSWLPICMASTTATSELSLRMWRTVSAWQNSCPRMYAE